MELGRMGVWWSSRREGVLDGPAAQALEDLGYDAVWISGGFAPGLAPYFARVLDASTRMVVASGIVSIWVSPPELLAQAAAKLEDAHPGRFLLGLGASHAPMVERYERPYSRMVGFLDGLDSCGPPVAPERRVLGALGPKMLALAAARATGAHPYFVPVEHTRRARLVLGDGPLLAPEVTVVLEKDPERARRLARTFTTVYLGLPNYTANLRSLGYGDEELAGGGSDRLVDDVVAWGDPSEAADKVRLHYDAGADHVCLQVLTPEDASGFPLEAYRSLADALGT